MRNTTIARTLGTLMKMSIPQRNYAAAKAMYDVHNKTKVSESDQAAYEDKYWLLLDNLRIAEKALIEWAQNKLKSEFPERYETVKVVFEKPIRRNDLREKLIDLCFRLEAK